MSSKHNETRFGLTGGEYSTFSKEEDEVALVGLVAVLTVPFDGELTKLSVPRPVEKVSTEIVARCSGGATERVVDDVGTEDVEAIRLSGTVIERLCELPPIDLPLVPPSPDRLTPPGPLELMPWARFASLSVTFVGDKVSFLGSGGDCDE